MSNKFRSRTSFVPRRNRNGSTQYGTRTQSGLSYQSTTSQQPSSDNSSLLVDLDVIRDDLKDKVSKSDAVSFYQSPYVEDYSGDNDYQKILSFDVGKFVVLNVARSVFGSVTQSIVMVSAQADAHLTSIYNYGFVAAINKQSYRCTLYIKTLPYSTPAIPSFWFQVIQGGENANLECMSEILRLIQSKSQGRQLSCSKTNRQKKTHRFNSM